MGMNMTLGVRNMIERTIKRKGEKYGIKRDELERSQ